MNTDRLVLWGMLVAVIGAWVAASFGYFGTGFTSIIVAIVVTLAAALVGAVQFDRKKRRMDAARSIDSNNPNFSAPMGNATWQVPTPYIDHKTGTGRPPGVQSYDDEEADRLTGRDPQTRRASEDEAP